MSKSPKISLSVVVPVHNEEGNVESLAREIAAAGQYCDIAEIFFVDDNSSDGTVEKLRSLTGEIPGLVIFHHENQSGQSAAIYTGIRNASSEWVVTMDGDGQNNPADIPKLVEALVSCGKPAVRLVNGNRNRGRNRKDSLVKRLSSRVANRVRSSLLKDNIPDSGCGLKLMHRATYLQLPYFTNLHRFTPALFIRTGSEILSVDVSHRERTAGQSHYGLFNRLWIGIVDLLGVAWLMKKGYSAKARRFDQVED